MDNTSGTAIGSGIFSDLQRKIDEDTSVKDVRPPRRLHATAPGSHSKYRHYGRLSKSSKSKASQSGALECRRPLTVARPCNACHPLEGAFKQTGRPYVRPSGGACQRLDLLTRDYTVPSVIEAAQSHIREEIQTVKRLADYASHHPYYKYSYAWSYQVQSCVSAIRVDHLHRPD